MDTAVRPPPPRERNGWSIDVRQEGAGIDIGAAGVAGEVDIGECAVEDLIQSFGYVVRPVDPDADFGDVGVIV